MAIDRRELLFHAQEKRDELLAEIGNFQYACENGTLGDYSDVGFLANLLQILLED